MASMLEQKESVEILLGERSLYDSHPYSASARPRRRRRAPSAAGSFSCMYYDVVFLFLIVSLSLVAVGAFFWPSKPGVKIVGLQFSGGISLGVQAQIRNPDLVSRNYSTISASASYEGTRLANATGDAVSVNPRNSSALLLPLEFTLSPLASNGTTMDIALDMKVGGRFKFLSFSIYVEARKSCTVGLIAENQTIGHQDCDL